jgi:hypothetical protein
MKRDTLLKRIFLKLLDTHVDDDKRRKINEFLIIVPFLRGYGLFRCTKFTSIQQALAVFTAHTLL